MVHLLGAVSLLAVGRGLREALAMLIETAWALILGFVLAGALQAFANRDGLRRSLGSHSPAGVLRATGLGMASSSCSYAAAAMAKSLFQLGADFTTAMVFMFASTNLVIELGVVLVVLIGWQFALSEFVGGALMIVLLVLVGARVFGPMFVARARAGASRGKVAPEDSSPEAPLVRDDDDAAETPSRWDAVRSLDGWVAAATYTVTDLRMVAREMAVGYIVAGLISTMVPISVFDDAFARGHGLWTSLENVAVGPLVALLSFVCSIGNVPLAAALWKGGISFGGVVAFIFADLITLPLLLVYRRYYGTGVTLRMLGVFWVVMSLAGLLTEELFRAAGLVPTSRPSVIAPTAISWNVTSVLDLLAVAALAGSVALYRYGRRRAPGTRFVIDPVCGMQVEIAHAPAFLGEGSARVYFCCEGCRDHYASPREEATAWGHARPHAPQEH